MARHRRTNFCTKACCLLLFNHIADILNIHFQGKIFLNSLYLQLLHNSSIYKHHVFTINSITLQLGSLILLHAIVGVCSTGNWNGVMKNSLAVIVYSLPLYCIYVLDGIPGIDRWHDSQGNNTACFENDTDKHACHDLELDGQPRKICLLGDNRRRCCPQ